MESIYLQLKKEIEYALNNKSLTLAYQAYGTVKMAYHLEAISKEQFLFLNDMVVTKGINNASLRLE